jgi:cytochrome c
MRRLLMVTVAITFMCLMASTVLADSEAEVQGMVNKAVALFKEKGKDYALRVLNSSSGPFRKGELYAFAGSMKDFTFVAHPVNAELLGTPQKDLKDAKGLLIFQEFVKVADNPGAGWVQYWWVRRAEKDPTLKRSFIERVPGEDIFVGAGFYVK